MDGNEISTLKMKRKNIWALGELKFKLKRTNPNINTNEDVIMFLKKRYEDANNKV